MLAVLEQMSWVHGRRRRNFDLGAQVPKGRVGENDQEAQGRQGEALWISDTQFAYEIGPTMVFQDIVSTKLLITPANVSAMTFVRPTIVGSFDMHASQALHGASLIISRGRTLKSIQLTWQEP